MTMLLTLGRKIGFILLASVNCLPALAIVIEETPYEEVEANQQRAFALMAPLEAHFQAYPQVPQQFDEQPWTVMELMSLSRASDPERLALLDSKIQGFEVGSASRVINWLEQRITLESEFLQQLAAMPQAQHPKCQGAIAAYERNRLQPSKDVALHLKLYRRDHKIFRFLVQWVFQIDYGNRILSRGELPLVASVCADPDGWLPISSIQVPLAESAYVGKPIEESLRL